jgi:type IV secretion system protein VirB8
MKQKTSKDTPNIVEAVQQAKSFEVSILDALRKSERRAWLMASVAMGMSLLLAAGYLVVMTLKLDIPYLVMADANTGVTSLARLTNDYGITANEAIGKSNVAHFVIARESYDWDLINRRDWHTVFSMASAPVSEEYQALFAEGNPNSPDKTLGQKTSLRIKIKSIVLLGGDPSKNQAPTGATVRFDRFLVDKQTAQITPLDSKIATLAFEYKSNLKMADELRVENPLGFQVLSYRVDNDAEGVVAPVLGALPNGAVGSVVGAAANSSGSSPNITATPLTVPSLSPSKAAGGSKSIAIASPSTPTKSSPQVSPTPVNPHFELSGIELGGMRP